MHAAAIHVAVVCRNANIVHEIGHLQERHSHIRMGLVPSCMWLLMDCQARPPERSCTENTKSHASFF